jgi:glyoxalase family protein
MGTVHHVALAVAGDDEQRTIQEELRRLGHNVTDVRDRNYFRSIYFREPGGVLLEVATEGPGFLVDEPREALGRKLMLPEWEESRRAEIEAALPDIHT